MDYLFLLPVMGLSVLLVGGGLMASRLLAPRSPGFLKNDTYECGEKTIGPAWVQFNVGYYIFGLIFLVFDVEAAFLYPWALVIREAGFVGLIEIALFIVVLLVGLLYTWRKGALEWV